MTATRIPTVGMYRTDKHLYYWAGEGPLLGVTSVINASDSKEGLVTWGKREVAKAALREWPMVEQLRKTAGDQAAVDFLANIPGYQRDEAARIGGAIHAISEQIDRGETTTISDEVAEMAVAYRRFLLDYAPEVVSVERAVISLRHGYGGTYDRIYRIGGRLVSTDIKTSKNVYPSVALQLAAYGGADFIGVEGDPKQYPIPRFDAYAVLHIRPDQYAKGYRLIEVKVTPDHFDAFLGALKLAELRKQPSPIGESYPLPVKEGMAA